MNIIEIVTGLMVLCGALFLSIAIILGEKTKGHIPREVQRRWRIMLSLMVFFLLGYLIFAALLVSRLRFPSELVTGPVFLGGAVFVYIVINLTRDTITRIKTAEEDLKELNETLEDRIVDRTAELQRSREFLKTVLDSLHDSVMIIDAREFKIVGANASFLKEFGVQEKEVIGRTCHEITHHLSDICQPPDNPCPLLNTVKTRGHSLVEHVHYTSDNKKIYAEVSTSPIKDASGKVVQIIHVERDITERKNAEERLKTYSEDLKHINEEMKNFAYIVSHDLRAPLVNIRGFSDELGRSIKEFTPLLEKYPGRVGADEKQRTEELLKKDIPEALGFIGSSVTRMDALINSILKLSRLGRNELKPELVHTEDIVHTLLNSLAHQIDMHKAEVTIGPLPDLIIDKTAAEQIFGNLLDNALKYLEPARSGKIEVTAEQNAGDIQFTVRDNGRGITKEDTQKVFELFRRVGRQDVPGEGMGLTYVKTLVRRLGGRIWCESEPGLGSAFSFTIPARAQTEK
jgi:PAS domain S-box-containing protein